MIVWRQKYVAFGVLLRLDPVYAVNSILSMIQRLFYRSAIIFFATFLLVNALQAQKPNPDSIFIRQIYDQALTDGRCYHWLEHLTKRVGPRLSGGENAARAVAWTRSVLDTLGLDSVWLQPVMVPVWKRGTPERVKMKSGGKSRDLNALALGGSVGTEGRAISAEVVEAKSWSDLERLGEAGIKGKIVLFNRPMDPTKIRSFDAYGGAVDQRVHGASKAAQYGAVGVLVRSMTQQHDDFPHTGVMQYDPAQPKIPAVAISTNDADELGKMLKKGEKVTVSMRLDCQTLPDALSYNVIGEIRGSQYPDRFLLVGGHLDSWDTGEGAHDDGTGCMQSMDVLRVLRRSGARPRHTIRCVLFMNEENGLRGGLEYAKEALRKGEYHVCAIETDAGGFTPRGFTFDGAEGVIDSLFERVTPLRPYFEPYGLTIHRGGGGADIGPLKNQNGLLCGYFPDSQRYFDFHHCAKDVFESVNQRELELGTACMAAMLYLLDRHLD